MRFYASQELGYKLVQFPNSNSLLTAATFKRRDDGRQQLAFYPGDTQGDEAVELGAGYGITIGFKQVDAWEQLNYVVAADAWTWNSTLKLYEAEPSFNGLRLYQLFVGASALNSQTGTSYTPVLADATKLVAISNAAAQTLTIPLNSAVAFAVNAVIYVLRAGDGTLTLSTTGLTMTYADDLTSALPQVSVIKLLKTAENAWTVSLAEELDEVNLMMEFSIRPAAGQGEVSSQTVPCVIENDVIRGGEGLPTDAQLPTVEGFWERIKASVPEGDAVTHNEGSKTIQIDTSGEAGANLAITRNATQVVVTSDTGTDATIPAADGTNAGVMTAAMVTKLTGIQAGATAFTVSGGFARFTLGATNYKIAVLIDA